MEYIWIVVASILSGIGTGFVGISAATVMVPVLIVLCPSFSGDGGVYAAQAVALSADILSSAITAAIYIRHGNINLKKGWIMLLSVSVMCILGSWAASLINNTTLGSFSLFLTFFIGLRFLLKSEKERPDESERKVPLDLKGIIISLFFGLTIGFGTGFVGTGGGMMMLIVFTLFLEMGLKESVGTTTIIMALTAFISSLSHFLIEPEIITLHWKALLIAVTLTTLSSLISAHVANRIRNNTSSLIAGVLLTLLGGSMITLSYWDYISQNEFIMSILECIIEFSEYIFFGALILVLVHVLFRNFPKDVFRKLLHLVAFSSLVEMTLIADTWYYAAITTTLFAFLIYPLLKMLEDRAWYSSLFVEKKKGEVRKSLVLFFGMYAILIVFCWGLFGRMHIAIASFLMWGVGDAAAALIGRRFGKHKTKLKYADPEKSWEGSLSMMLFSFLSGMLGILLSGSYMWYEVVFYPLLASPVAAYTELISKNGDDTITVPVATAAVLIVLSYIF